MSRRKQSNPKPLKRKTEDSLEEVADLLHLPTDLFQVRDPEDDVHEYTVYTRRSLQKGVHFGPFRGHTVGEKSDSAQVIKVKGPSGEDELFSLEDEIGGWLKLLRPGSSCELCNAALCHNDSSIWCSITCDVDSDTEILVDVRRRSSSPSPPAPCDAEDERMEIDRRRTPASTPCEEKTMGHNGTSDNLLKYESPSPVSPDSDAASPASASGSRNEGPRQNGMPYLNGYPPAFPYGALVTEAGSDGHFKCEACDIAFNSQRILEVHRAYYCQGKMMYGAAISSDTDTEDNTSKTDTRTNESPSPNSNHDTSANHKIPRQPEPPTSRCESSMSSKRRRTSSQNDVLNTSSRMSRVFKCPYCSYSSDKKASLTRHVRMHGSSTGVDGHCDMPLPTPPMARYCANCDIQFASYKNYQVHKEFYCNTRHVHKNIGQPSSPNPGQQQQQNQQQQQSQQQPATVPTQQQPHSPTQPQTTTPEPATSSAHPKNYNNMMMNQPLYAAISTSPLILVPCSYVAGGGLSPAAGLIPAGNIIIPNPGSSAATPDTGTDSQGPNVIPTYTVVPGGATVVGESSSGEDSNKEDGKVVEKDEVKKPESSTNIEKDAGREDGEKPLDLSFKKKDYVSEKARAIKSSPEPGSRSHLYASSSSGDENCPLAPRVPLPILPIVNPAADLSLIARGMDPSTGSIPPVLVPPSVLVKQGTSKCLECNIVFYKHENYLVHKKRYCASRLQKPEVGSSPERVKSVEPTSPDRDDGASRGTQKSPMSSPRISNSRTPPVTDPENSRETSPNHQGTSAAMLQYFCMACGIKYTSVDNLRVHQLYYCSKRESGAMVGVPSFSNRNNNNQDFKCSKCKNAYPSEELLRQHPCVVQRKCPYCDVYCPTLSAAQRHLVTHTGIKSFRCSLCGYKGHTLRGMRTHIRIHLDKNSSTPEEAYILCMDEGGAEIGCASRKSSSARVNSERIKSVIATEPPPPAEAASSTTPAVLPSDVVAIKAVSDDSMVAGDTTHWCQICGYSSSYKGNVVRHVKLVHKDLVATQAMSSIVNSRPSVDPKPPSSESGEHVGRRTPRDFSSAEHSNSSSSLDVKPIVNGLLKADKPEDKALVLKTESVSPPPPEDNVSLPKGVKRPLSEEGQCPSESFSSKAGPQYCNACDISFNFLSNFIAHKRFYCTMQRGEISGQESSAAQSVQ